MTADEWSVFILILTLVNHATGIWNGSGIAVADYLKWTSRQCQLLLKSLRVKGYLDFNPVPGRKGNYPITVKNFHGSANGDSVIDVLISERGFADTLRSPNGGSVKGSGSANGDSHIQEVIHKPQEKVFQEDPSKKAFDDFWTAYPTCDNKAHRGRALTAWRMLRSTDLPSDVMTGLEKWQASNKWRTNPDYIPSPTTFLDQRQWENEPPTYGGTKNEQRIARTLAATAAVAARHGIDLSGHGPKVAGPALFSLQDRTKRTRD